MTQGRHSTIAGLTAAVLSVAAVIGATYGLREFAPPISTGVVFLLPVLLVSSYWGLWPGLGTSVLAAAAFNFFQIEPTGAFNVACLLYTSPSPRDRS